MSVLLETSAGAIVIDLFVEDCPATCLNFLKLCKLKYYHNCLVYNVQHNYIVQTGDPCGSGEGGEALFAVLGDARRRFFPSETRKHLKHNKIGEFRGKDRSEEHTSELQSLMRNSYAVFCL